MRLVPHLVLFLLPLSLWADPALDRKIEEAARASYNFRAVLQKRVDAHSSDGVVTLTGTVADRTQKALAEQSVRGLPGVVGVNNEIDLASPEHERADGWIALKIRSLLLFRSDVSAAHTDVTVRDGVVTLSGSAKDEMQKTLTADYAREVEGVKDVRNRLEIRRSPDAAAAE